MDKEIVKDIEEEKVDVNKIIEEKLNELRKETDNKLNRYEEILKQKDEEITEYKKLAESKKEEDNDLKKVMENRKAIELERKQQQEKEEFERVKKENNMLKLQTKISEFTKKHPYLEEILSEKIAEGKITTYEQLETEFTPTEIKMAKERNEYKQLMEKTFGKDPMGEYVVNSDVKNQLTENKQQAEAREEILKLLNI